MNVRADAVDETIFRRNLGEIWPGIPPLVYPCYDCLCQKTLLCAISDVVFFFNLCKLSNAI